MYKSVFGMLLLIGTMLPFAAYSQEQGLTDSANSCCKITPGEIYFPNGSVALTEDAHKMLQEIASDNRPAFSKVNRCSYNMSCRIYITIPQNSSGKQTSKEWLRVCSIVKPIAENGINPNSIIFQYTQSDSISVDTYLVSTQCQLEIGCAPPPFPKLRRD